jgi:hypothetical protein
MPVAGIFREALLHPPLRSRLARSAQMARRPHNTVAGWRQRDLDSSYGACIGMMMAIQCRPNLLVFDMAGIRRRS